MGAGLAGTALLVGVAVFMLKKARR